MPLFTLPYIRFGRQCSDATCDEDYYTILSCSPGIPEFAVELFRRDVSKCVQWDTTGNEEIYPACFLLWRVTEFSFWFARLSDTGRDSRNRPHAMGITAVFVDESFLAELPDDVASFFAFLARSTIWESGFQGATCEFFYEPEHEKEMESLENKISAFINFSPNGTVKSLFIASHSHFIARGIDTIVYLNDYRSRSETTKVSSQPGDNSVTSNPPLFLTPSEQAQTPKPSKERIVFLTPLSFLFVTLLLGVVLLGLFACVTYLRSDTLTEELQRSKQEIQLLKNQLNTHKQELKSKERELEDAQRETANLEKQLAQARLNANRELREQHGELVKRYNKFHEETTQLLKKWSPEQHGIHPGN